jgi:hypothetical protein
MFLSLNWIFHFLRECLNDPRPIELIEILSELIRFNGSNCQIVKLWN